jgi:selenide,water dikinase
LCQLPYCNEDPNLLVGIETSDDAGIYRLNDNQAIVQTVDFFTPIVDDPYSFGQIAAANALSDIYAMGAQPITALNLVSFPIDKLEKDILLEILRGGKDKVQEAGAVIIGGHSIDDSEPKYGLAVTGLVHPDKILTNSGSKQGDYLVLTKPLGVGIIATGIKRGIVQSEDEDQVVQTMAHLNKEASLLASELGVNACTDITGFGLLGHLHEMMKASGLKADIFTENIPVLNSVWHCLDQGMVPGGTLANLEYLEKYLESFCSLDWKLILGDAQTSGGLLLSVPEGKIGKLLAQLSTKNGCPQVIGRVYSGEAGKISVYEAKINF